MSNTVTVGNSSPGLSKARPTARRVIGGILLAVLLVIVVYPVVWMIATSFKSPEEINSNLGIIPETWTPSNYSAGWTAIPGLTFGRFFLNSLLIAVLSVIGTVLSAALTAFAFTRLRFRFSAIWFSVMIFTLLLPTHVLIVPQYVIFNYLGWVGTYLPLIVPKYFATEAFFVFLMVQFMRGLPRELDEAAELDGASKLRFFWSIILPLAKPALVTAAIFQFLWTWNDFFSQLIYINSPSLYTLPVALKTFIDSSGQAQLGPMFAMAVLSLIPVFIFFLAFQRLLVQGISSSGVKG